MNDARSCCHVLYCWYEVAAGRAYSPAEPRMTVSGLSVHVNAKRGSKTLATVVPPAVFVKPTPGAGAPLTHIGEKPAGQLPNEAPFHVETGAKPGAPQFSRSNALNQNCRAG